VGARNVLPFAPLYRASDTPKARSACAAEPVNDETSTPWPFGVKPCERMYAASCARAVADGLKSSRIMLADMPCLALDCDANCASSFWCRGFRKTEIRTGAAGDAWPTTFAPASERWAEPASVAMCGVACAWWVCAWAGWAAATAATAPARATNCLVALTSGSNLGDGGRRIRAI